MNITRIYASDDGESHMEDIDIHFTLLNPAADASSIRLSPPAATSSIKFLAASTSAMVNQWWPVPARQFVIFLQGRMDVHTSDGSSRSFAPGSVLFVEDTFGKGHMNKTTMEHDILLAFVPAAEGMTIADLSRSVGQHAAASGDRPLIGGS